DICSPVATDPTWNKLDAADHAELKKDGGPLWHMLLEELKPQIVTVSVAKAHIEDITFTPLTSWRVIHTFRKKADGKRSAQPYQIRGRWYDVGGKESLFIFARAAYKPFGLLANIYKLEAGAMALDAYRGRSGLLLG
ncbi:MAG: hypothetical protein OXI83_10375, partial [Gemmatimonadota bacterium]|nr:hypothetical protein [Gemmatimonadota bacterium]